MAIGLIATGLLAGRGLTMTAGAAAVAIAAALSGLAGPRRMRLGTGTVALGLGGLAAVMVTAAYVGATTPTAGWFGSVVSHGPRDGDEVAISFDDGPNPPYTLQIRDILDAYGAKGTFFTVGEALDARPDVSRALMEDGHLLANHSYHHDALRWLDPRYPELEAAQAAFERNLGVCPTLFRPPHGNHTPFMARAVHRKGMKMVTWDVSAGDWATDDAALVAKRVLDNVKSGSIILLHDGMDGNIGADRSVVVAALPLILDGLRVRGLRPVTLDRLLGVPGYLQTC
ncbi:MAG: polysaccharide deacetylase family protein [Dehalococcoidia bacterium]|nr:polysaccharide deacetylase family protein [Dehalococcoidia bacterium]